MIPLELESKTGKAFLQTAKWMSEVVDLCPWSSKSKDTESSHEPSALKFVRVNRALGYRTKNVLAFGNSKNDLNLDFDKPILIIGSGGRE